MPVHMYGPADMDQLFELRESQEMKILENAAVVLGAQYLGRRSGNPGFKCEAMDGAASASSHANKIFTTGPGRMVVTNYPMVAIRARSYRNLCFRPEKRFLGTELGYNFRIKNLQATVVMA